MSTFAVHDDVLRPTATRVAWFGGYDASDGCALVSFRPGFIAHPGDVLANWGRPTLLERLRRVPCQRWQGRKDLAVVESAKGATAWIRGGFGGTTPRLWQRGDRVEVLATARQP